MRRIKTTALGVGAFLGLAAGAASAASDYLLKLEGIPGESAGGAIELSSWSFGASNPTSVGSSGLSGGRVQSPRDAASGLPTGKRQHEPIRVSQAVTTSEAAVGQVVTVSVEIRESPTSPVARACAQGKHIPTATLSKRGVTYTLSDVVVSNCTVTGDMRRAEFKGHVTLIR